MSLSGEIRNDFYVTLKSADLEKGNKKSARNVEVRVTVVNEAGKQIEVRICVCFVEKICCRHVCGNLSLHVFGFLPLMLVRGIQPFSFLSIITQQNFHVHVDLNCETDLLTSSQGFH